MIWTLPLVGSTTARYKLPSTFCCWIISAIVVLHAAFPVAWLEACIDVLAGVFFFVDQSSPAVSRHLCFGEGDGSLSPVAGSHYSFCSLMLCSCIFSISMLCLSSGFHAFWFVCCPSGHRPLHWIHECIKPTNEPTRYWGISNTELDKFCTALAILLQRSVFCKGAMGLVWLFLHVQVGYTCAAVWFPSSSSQFPPPLVPPPATHIVLQ